MHGALVKSEEGGGFSAPNWVWNGLVLVALVGCCSWIFLWAAGELAGCREKNEAQDTRLATNEEKIAAFKERLIRIEDKIDRLLGRQ